MAVEPRVGGMTLSEAGRAWGRDERLRTAPISLRLGDEAWRVSPEEMGTVVDVEAASGLRTT